MDKGSLDTRNNLLSFFLFGFVCFICILFLFEIIKKSILGHSYYERLAEGNRTKEVAVIAPRGVFYDRNNIVLVGNQKDKKHGYRRDYVYSYAIAHMLGYLGLPDKTALHDYTCGSPPVSSQYVGKVGLERYFECILRGSPGKVLYETNAAGKVIAELARNEPVQGVNINLAIDARLQEAASRAFAGAKGGAIASDPKTGEILLFYSSPSFDPSVLTGTKPKEYQSLVQDKNQPLFNRLTLGVYPPGSVIKPLIAASALEEGDITAATTYEDTGIFELGGVKFGNWYYLQYGKKEGMVDVIKAIGRSNDIFFYHVGVEMGIDTLSKWLHKFGFAGNSISPYFVQAHSLIPDPAWKEKTLGEKWYLGDTVNTSIGQGYMLVNPIDMHSAFSVIAGSGMRCQLMFEKNKPPHCSRIIAHNNSIALVRQGMRKACETGGTGWPFFDFKVKGSLMSVGCKTGTAESQEKGKDPHAWFTVFAPYDNPRIALTVFVENGGEGSNVAAPIAKKILAEYFK